MDVRPPGIAGEIAAAGGRVTFARFMELALTHATEGYYSTPEAFLGPRGDFSTAPTLSPDFCDTVARLVEELLLGVQSGQEERQVTLIELGGGDGQLLRAVLARLRSERPDLKGVLTSLVVEVGQGARARQRRALARPLREGWRVEWVPALAAALAEASGGVVVVGNEFVDALPVHVVHVSGESTEEAWVGVRAASAGETTTEMEETRGPLTAESRSELGLVFGTAEVTALRAFTGDGVIEVRPAVRHLLEGLAASGLACCLLTIDYGQWFGLGGVDSEAGGASQYGRTLRGYVRHERVEDVFARVGRQDVSADVDFRALDGHGRRAGFETVLYTTVAELLRGDSGVERLTRLRARAEDSLEADRRAAVLQELLDSEGVGGAYRVMLQVRERES